MAPIKLDDKCGYVDKKMRVRIPFIFESADCFYHKTAAVCLNRKWGLINPKGNIIVSPQFWNLSHLYKEKYIAEVRVNGKKRFAILDQKGNFFSKLRFEELGFFTNGLAKFELNKKIGFMNENFKIAIKPRFDAARYFQKGLFQVEIFRGKKVFIGIIDTKGKEVLKIKYDNLFEATEGLSRVTCKGKTGYVNEKGQIAIQLTYEEGKDFTQGLAAVKSKKLWGWSV